MDGKRMEGRDMEGSGLERRIAMLRKTMEGRRSPEDREYRSGAVKFSDAVVALMAYLQREQRTLTKPKDQRDDGEESTTA